MAEDDEAARKARAEALKKRIAQLAHPQAGADEQAQPPASGMSPRDFIHEKMQELENGEK
jgi:hypothetical protein